MVVPPGYSVNDLITIAGWVKGVYEAFFHEFKNAASQLEDLARDVDAFQEKLRQYQQNLTDRGLEDSGKESVRKTLLQCANLLEEYKAARKDGWKRSFMGRVRTALFAAEEEELNRLRTMLDRHKLDMVLDSVNIMSQGQRSHQMLIAAVSIPERISASPTIPEAGMSPISPPATPNLFSGSPLLLGGAAFDPVLPSPSQSAFFDAEPEPATPSLILRRPEPATPSRILRKPVPATLLQPSNLEQQSTPASEFSFPEPVLLYGAAEVRYGPKKKDWVGFTRKPTGNPYERGRQIEIKDQMGNQCFRHRIRVTPGDALYPYTWHSKFQESPDHFVVNFKEIPPPSHKISRNFGEQKQPTSIPIYIFTDQQDYEDFQGQVRGKLLEGMFEVNFIDSAVSSNKKHEASNEHLKIWRDRISKECSVSYYASTAEKPGHVEYPISMFHPEIQEDHLNIRLNFVAAKKGRTYSNAFGRSPSDSSASTAAKFPRIFDRTNSGMTSVASSTTSAPPSRASIASSNFSGSWRTPNSDKESALESQAKRLKFLDFEFSDVTGNETARFKNLYERLCQETTPIGVARVMDWQQTTRPGRPESMVSTSPRGTPYTRSPEMRVNQLDHR